MSMTTTVQSFWISQWHPTPLNVLLEHPMKAHRFKKQDGQFIAAYGFRQRISHAKRKRRVDLHVVLQPGQRGCDPDAYWKSTLDGLVNSRLLVNDNTQWCKQGDVTFGRAPKAEPDAWGTAITLTDLD